MRHCHRCNKILYDEEILIDETRCTACLIKEEEEE